MSFLNATLRVLFDVLLYPFRSLPPVVGLLVLSLLTAVAMLLAFKATSNQTKLAEVKRRIHASLFEIRLFNDDLRAIFQAQLDLLRSNLTYLRLSLVPMLWMIVPFVLVVAQLQFHYGYQGLEAGRTALLKVQLAQAPQDEDASPSQGEPTASLQDSAPAWTPATEPAPKPEVTLELPQGWRAETPAVWIPSLREMTWRLAATGSGTQEIRVLTRGETFTKTVTVSDRLVRRSPVRHRSSFLNQLLYPAEPPLPKDGPLESITLTYPDAGVGVLGMELHWMVVYFVLTVALAFALRNRFGVTL